MPEEEATKPENERPGPPEPARPARPRRFFTRRNALWAFFSIALLGLSAAVLLTVFYRYGVFDTYVKTQFVAKMADIGVVFDADVFRVTVNPLALELQNATFNDKVSGEKLFFIRSAHLDLTVKDLYSWQLSRDISIDKTAITGAEAWVKFDENGRSNFSNLKLIEREKGAAVNFRYESVVFSLQDSVVHFGDLSRKISGEGRNMAFLLSPAGATTADGRPRYNF